MKKIIIISDIEQLESENEHLKRFRDGVAYSLLLGNRNEIDSLPEFEKETAVFHKIGKMKGELNMYKKLT